MSDPRIPPAVGPALRALAEHPEDVDSLAPLAVQAGATTREIAAVLGIDPTTVARRYGSQPRTGSRKRADVTDQEILELRTEGLSLQEIATTLSLDATVPVSKTMVRKRLLRIEQQT